MATMCMAVYMFLHREGEEGRRILLDEEFSCCRGSFINEEFNASEHTSVIIFTDLFLTSNTGPLTHCNLCLLAFFLIVQ